MESPSLLSRLTYCRCVSCTVCASARSTLSSIAVAEASHHVFSHIQVDGPHGAPAQDWAQFESAVLISAGLTHNLNATSLPLFASGRLLYALHA